MIFVRSSFDLSLNHLGVLLHGENSSSCTPRFHVEFDRWDGRDHFAKLQLILLLLDIGSWMLRDWLAATFLCDVFLLVSVAVLRFALPAVGYALLRAVGFALLPAVGFAPDLRCSSRAVLVPLLLYFILLATSSLAVVPSVLLVRSSESLCDILRLRGSFLASPNITTQHCAAS